MSNGQSPVTQVCGCVNLSSGGIRFCPLHAHAGELLAACAAFVLACDSAPPVQLMQHIARACEQARAAIAAAEEKP